VLPPQIQLAGTSKGKHRKAIKAEPVAIKDYWITSRRLAPGARADGIVVFDRPTFKESSERLLLAVAQAEESRSSCAGTDSVCGSGLGRCKVTRRNGHSDNGNTGAIQEPAGDEVLNDLLVPPAPASTPLPEVPDKSQTESQGSRSNRTGS